MAQNFNACDREQELLLPPGLREWLPEDHFAWFVLDAVEEMDLAELYAVYREDGHRARASSPPDGTCNSRCLEREREGQAEPVPNDRSQRLAVCQRRLVEDWRRERFASRDYEAHFERGVLERGRKAMGSGPAPYTPPARPEGKLNTTDPDAKRMKQGRAFLPADNAQAVTTEGQIVIAAELTSDGADFGQLEPMVAYAERELERAGVKDKPAVVLADAGYWSNGHIDALRELCIIPLVAPDTTRNKPLKTRLGGPYEFIRRVIASERGGAPYAQRQWMVEPVFAQIKSNRRIDRFKRSGFAAARSERRPTAATHNLPKLHRQSLRAAGAQTGRPGSRRAGPRGCGSGRLCATTSRESTTLLTTRQRLLPLVRR